MNKCPQCKELHNEPTKLCVPCKIKARYYFKKRVSKPGMKEKIHKSCKAWQRRNPEKMREYARRAWLKRKAKLAEQGTTIWMERKQKWAKN